VKRTGKHLVFSNGRHNAFTDVTLFGDYYYLVFRAGDHHVSYDGRILACRSTDGIRWSEPIEIINTPTDDRDPKLFVFDSKLFCTFQSRWASEEDPHRRFPMIAYSADGLHWSKAIQCYDNDYVPWRPKVREDRVYNAFYKHSPTDPSAWRVVLGISHNGLWWNHVSTIYSGDRANETDLHFLTDGSAMAIVRREGMSSVIARAEPPYKEWNYEDLGVAIHSPCVMQAGDTLFLCGREYDHDTGSAGVSLWTYDNALEKRMVLEPLAPKRSQDGITHVDCAYPGMQKLHGETGLLISYYYGNNHESSIYRCIIDL